jgi:hypothetical protein
MNTLGAYPLMRNSADTCHYYSQLNRTSLVFYAAINPIDR